MRFALGFGQLVDSFVDSSNRCLVENLDLFESLGKVKCDEAGSNVVAGPGSWQRALEASSCALYGASLSSRPGL